MSADMKDTMSTSRAVSLSYWRVSVSAPQARLSSEHAAQPGQADLPARDHKIWLWLAIAVRAFNRRVKARVVAVCNNIGLAVTTQACLQTCLCRQPEQATGLKIKIKTHCRQSRRVELGVLMLKMILKACVENLYTRQRGRER